MSIPGRRVLAHSPPRLDGHFLAGRQALQDATSQINPGILEWTAFFSQATIHIIQMICQPTDTPAINRANGIFRFALVDRYHIGELLQSSREIAAVIQQCLYGIQIEGIPGPCVVAPSAAKRCRIMLGGVPYIVVFGSRLGYQVKLQVMRFLISIHSVDDNIS